MNLEQYLKAGPLQHTSAVTLFVAKEYPFLFFSSFVSRLQALSPYACKTVSYEGVSFSTIQGQLTTTFLGQKELLFLGNISDIADASMKKQLLALLHSYEGPHSLIGCVHPDDLSVKKNALDLDEPLSVAAGNALFSFVFPHLSAQDTQDFFKVARSAGALDHCVILAQYKGVLGKNNQLFKDQWLEKVITPDASLFELSQYLFSRKPEQFWKKWHSLKEEYAAPFWTTFWSEQLWRAHYVIKLYKENNFAQAKQLSYRLPFSFLQRDWKTMSQKELQRAHQFLYEGDCAFKNGSSDFFLEVFYATFMAKQFA